MLANPPPTGIDLTRVLGARNRPRAWLQTSVKFRHAFDELNITHHWEPAPDIG
jgi:hypothetical protein